MKKRGYTVKGMTENSYERYELLKLQNVLTQEISKGIWGDFEDEDIANVLNRILKDLWEKNSQRELTDDYE